MSTSGSWYNVTGWKAVLAAVVIVALIGMRVWNRTPHYREFASEAVAVPCGHAFLYDFELKADLRIKADLSGMSGGEYLVYIVTEESKKKLDALAASGSGDVKSIPMVAQRRSHSDESIEYLALKAGRYFIVVENAGDKDVTGKLRLSILK